MMFEPIIGRVSEFGETLAAWVEMDRERGRRHERILQRVERNTRLASDAEYESITQVVPAAAVGAGALTEIDLPVCPQGFVWEYTVVAASVDGGVGAVRLDVFLDDVSAGAIAGHGEGTGAASVLYPQPLVVTEGRNLSVRVVSANADNVRIAAQLKRVRPASKRLTDVDVDEAKGSHEGRPTVNETNFDRPEVPEEQGTRTDAMEPAYPQLSGNGKG